MNYRIGDKFRPTDCGSDNKRYVYTITEIDKDREILKYSIQKDGRFQNVGSWNADSWDRVAERLSKLHQVLE